MRKEAIIEALSTSDLSEAASAVHLLREGELKVDSIVSSCDVLLSTYQIRLDHIRAKPGDHASRLSTATSEFVDNLKRHGAQLGRWLTIKGSQELYFIVFCLEDGKLLGCLPVVSKLEVAPERWSTLWGENG
jgi:hypothetical protein